MIIGVFHSGFIIEFIFKWLSFLVLLYFLFFSLYSAIVLQHFWTILVFLMYFLLILLFIFLIQFIFGLEFNEEIIFSFIIILNSYFTVFFLLSSNSFYMGEPSLLLQDNGSNFSRMILLMLIFLSFTSQILICSFVKRISI